MSLKIDVFNVKIIIFWLNYKIIQIIVYHFLIHINASKLMAVKLIIHNFLVKSVNKVTILLMILVYSMNQFVYHF